MAVLEELLIKIKAMVDGGGFDKAKADLKNLETATEKLDGVSPSIKPKIDDNAKDDLDNIRKVSDDLDGLSPKIKPGVDDGAGEDLETLRRKADDLDGLAPKIKPTVDNSEAMASIRETENGLSNLEGAALGIASGVGAGMLLGRGYETAYNMDKSWRNWVGSLQQSGYGLDAAKQKADELYTIVNKLSSEGQSNDSFFKSVAGLQIAMNPAISEESLKLTEKVVAGYEMLGGRTGATFYEMEKELKNYLSTGDLGKMQDTLSSLKDPNKWIGLLQGADTVEERVEVLRQMLEEEGIMGALDIDAPTKSVDQLKSMFDAGFTKIADKLLDILKPIADFLTDLDDKTGGLSTDIMTIAALGALAVGALSGLKQVFDPAIKGASTLLDKLGLINRTPCSKKCTTTGGDGAGGTSRVWQILGAVTLAAATVYITGSAINYTQEKARQLEPSPEAQPGISVITQLEKIPLFGGLLSSGTGAAKLGISEHPNDFLGAIGSALGWLGVGVGKSVGIETGQPRGGLNTSKGLLEQLNLGDLLLSSPLSKLGFNPLDLFLPKTASAASTTGGTGGGMWGPKGPFSYKDWLKMPDIQWPSFDDITRQVNEALPDIEWPSWDDVSKWIDDNIPKIDWPDWDDVKKWINDRIPKIRWPTWNDVQNWILNRIPKVSWPSWGDVSNWIQSHIPRISWPSWGDVSNWILSRIPSISWPSWGDVAGWIQAKIAGITWWGGDAGADTGYVGPVGSASGDVGADIGYIGPIGNSSTKKNVTINITQNNTVNNESQIDYANKNLVTQITLALNKDNNAAGN